MTINDKLTATTRYKIVFLAFCVSFLTTLGTGRAEEDLVAPVIERGFAADKAYQHLGIDSVDLASGTVTLAIPIGPRYPVNGGFSYGLTLVYNSSVWDFETINGLISCSDPDGCQFVFTQAFPTKTSNGGLGWRLSMGELFDPADTDNPNWARWVFVSQDGAQHSFFHELHEGEEDPDNQNTWYTHDGSYLRMIFEGLNRRIDFPNGTQYTFVPDGGVKWRLGMIEDAHGNFVSILDTKQNGHVVTRTITDSQGRTHTIDYVQKTVDNQTLDYVEYVNLKGFGDQTSTYRFHYSDVLVDRSGQDDDDEMINSGDITDDVADVSLLSRLELPDTSSGGSLDTRSYSFGYCLSDSCLGFDGVADAPGMMKSLRFPSGGGIKWEYQTWSYFAH